MRIPEPTFREDDFANAAGEVVLRVGNIALNTQTKEITIDSQPVPMGKRLQRLLELFMRNTNTVLSHERIDNCISTEKAGNIRPKRSSGASTLEPYPKQPYVNRVNLAIHDLKKLLKLKKARGYEINNIRKDTHGGGGYRMYIL